MPGPKRLRNRRHVAQRLQAVVLARDSKRARYLARSLHLRVFMKSPLEITFRGMSHSDSVATDVAGWLERLDSIHDRIQHCHVWIDQPHHHHQTGSQFEVRVVVAIPGHDVVATQNHDDVYVAISDAFTSARRQLLDHLEIRRDAKRDVA